MEPINLAGIDNEVFALGRPKPEEARVGVEEAEMKRRGEKQSLDEAFRQVALALEAVERDTREGRVGEGERGECQAGALSPLIVRAGRRRSSAGSES